MHGTPSHSATRDAHWCTELSTFFGTVKRSQNSSTLFKNTNIGCPAQFTTKTNRQQPLKVRHQCVLAIHTAKPNFRLQPRYLGMQANKYHSCTGYRHAQLLVMCTGTQSCRFFLVRSNGHIIKTTTATPHSQTSMRAGNTSG